MKKLLLTAGAIALAVPMILGAQPRRYYDPPPRRDYGGGPHISRVIADCEERSNRFQVSLRRALDHSGLRDTRREDELNSDAVRLERSLNRVRESWNREHDARRTREHVSRAIEVSQDINRTMVRRRLDPEVQREWGIVRGELNRLAEAFELPRIGW